MESKAYYRRQIEDRVRRLFSWRFYRGVWQLWWRGWCDCDTWNLDYTLAQMALPRLRLYKKEGHGHPANLTADQWCEILDEIEFALTQCADPEYECYLTPTAPAARVQNGLDLLGKHWLQLWN